MGGVGREEEEKKEEQRNLVTRSKKVHTRMSRIQFSRSVSSFPREFPKRVPKRLGTGRAGAHARAITLCIYAQVDIGKSVQVGRLGTGSADRGVFPARCKEFRDLGQEHREPRDIWIDPDQRATHEYALCFRIIDRWNLVIPFVYLKTRETPFGLCKSVQNHA